MSDEIPTRPSTPTSKTFPSVECPLCLHQDLWGDVETCPGCNRSSETILEEGVGRISQFKLPGLYASFPALARVDTIREMPAVKSEKT